MDDFLKGLFASLAALSILAMPFLLATAIWLDLSGGLIGALAVLTMLAHLATCAFILGDK